MTPRRVGADYPLWPEVLALLRAAFAYMAGRIDPPSSLGRLTLPGMAATARDGAVWVIEDAGRPVGCLFASPRAGALHLGKIAVAAGLRGRGLARALIGAAEAEARARGLPALELQSRVELAEAHAAFRALGFAAVGTTAHPGHDRPTSVTFRRPVAPPAPEDPR